MAIRTLTMTAAKHDATKDELLVLAQKDGRFLAACWDGAEMNALGFDIRATEDEARADVAEHIAAG